MKINLFVQPYGDLGIPIHSRELLTEYLKINKDAVVCPIFNGNSSQLPSDIKSRMLKPNLNNPSFIFWYPDSFDQLTQVTDNVIGYYIFEYTNIPENYVASINKLKAICTASDWAAEVLKANGVITKIFVVPGGVNTLKYNKTIRRSAPANDEPFVFGHIGKYENRKNTDLLVKCFLDKFNGNDKVKLLLSVTNPHVKEDSKTLLENKFGVHKNIEFVPFINDIRNFYKKIHCAVFPTNAEGIGLPIVEALACGIPTIVSYNSGIKQYINEDIAILLTDLKMIPVYDKNFFPNEGQFGFWESPKEEELSNKLAEVSSNYEEYLKIGDNAAVYMHEKFNWKIAADKLDEVLRNAI